MGVGHRRGGAEHHGRSRLGRSGVACAAVMGDEQPRHERLMEAARRGERRTRAEYFVAGLLLGGALGYIVGFWSAVT